MNNPCSSVRIDWWNLRNGQLLFLDQEALSVILSRFEQKGWSKYRIAKEYGKLSLYSSFAKPGKAGIDKITLLKMCHKINVDLDYITEHLVSVGKRSRYDGRNFPIVTKPVWASLLGHMFFDGYSDKYSIRYSQYDISHRMEFLQDVAEIFGPDMPVNAPQNLHRDVDLPQIAQELVRIAFNVQNTYSKECRVPESFIALSRRNKDFGWYFLKAAFIDEGTICGSAVYVVRGIRNRDLAYDIKALCSVLCVDTVVSISSRDLIYGNAYSVRVCASSFTEFFLNVSRLTFFCSKKLCRLKRIFLRHIHKTERDPVSGRFMKRKMTHADYL